MRISDWSSDVCSSDLDVFPPVADRQRGRSSLDEVPLIRRPRHARSEEHTSELQSLMRISYAVFCLKKKKITYHGKYQIYIQLSNNYNIYSVTTNILENIITSVSLISIPGQLNQTDLKHL